MSYYICLVITAICVGCSTLLMRWGGSKIGPADGVLAYCWMARWWFLGLGCSWICGLIFAYMLTKTNVIIAMSIYTPLAYAVTFIGGVALLKEPLVTHQIVGCAFVFVGLVLLLVKS